MLQLLANLLSIQTLARLIKPGVPGLLLSMLAFGVATMHAQDSPSPLENDRAPLRVLDGPTSILQGDTTLPDALYLRNENGAPIFIPQVRYAEFERYLRDRSGARQVDLPSALLESIDVTGTIREGYAELKLELSMSVTDASASVVRLPLAMQNMNWLSRPKTKGGKTNMVVAGKDDEGLTWWVEPDGAEKYSLELNAVVKTEQSFSESSLRLELPESASRIKIEIPGQALNIQWLGATGEVLQTEVMNSTTLANIRGRGGIGTLVWRDQILSRDLGSVEVDSSTRLVRSDDGKEYRASTRLRIISDNRVGPRELMIRLPEGARWNPMPTNAAPSTWTLNASRFSEEDATAKSTVPLVPGQAPRERLQLRLSDRGRNFVEEIPIDWTLPVEDSSNNNFTLTGIEVEGVQRHEGHLIIVLPMTARFSWLPSSEYLLTQQAPANDLSEAMEYDFRFSRQPIRLQAIVAEDDSRVRWRPDYLVTFEPDLVRLQGILTFSGDRSQLFGLNILGGAWQLDTAVWDKTGELIETEVVDGNKLRFLPSALLASEDPETDNPLTSTSPVTIRISAFQSLPPGEVSRVNFQLPQISMLSDGKRRTERGNGTLVINRGSWQINQAEQRAIGMARTSESPSSLRALLSELPIGDLQIFRFQSSGLDAKWTGRLRRVPRVVTATMRTHLAIQSQEWRCERRWSIRSLGPALERLPIRIPSAWLELDDSTGDERLSAQVKIYADGQPLVVGSVQDKQDEWTIVELQSTSWPEAFELEITYREAWPVPTLTTPTANRDLESTIRVLLPQLELKPSALINDHISTIEAGPKLLCQIEQETSKPIRCTAQDQQVVFPLSDASPYVVVGVTALAAIQTNLVDVQRVWLQSVINDRNRRERCVMRLQTKQPSLAFQLPPEWSAASTTLLINGREQSLEPDVEAGVYRVLLPRAEGDMQSGTYLLDSKSTSESVSDDRTPIVIEFWNWSSSNPSWTKVVKAELPVIKDCSGFASLVWQVILPINEHLWTSSSTLLADQRWVWQNLGWRRQASFSQERAERELGASLQPSIAVETNQYVFASIGNIGALPLDSIGQIRVIPRYVLWLPVAAVVLLLTALWPRMGVLRHPWMLLAVVVILSLLSMSAPDMTIMLVQAALASLAIVALVKTMRWALRQRVHRRSIFVNRTLPGPASRPVPRSDGLDESAASHPKTEALGKIASPSTHAMENAPLPDVPEVRR